MKTLDEVIKACEQCYGKYIDCDECLYTEVNAEGVTICAKDRLEDDSLFYLREYRDKQHDLDIRIADSKRAFAQLGEENQRYQEAIKNCERVENKYRIELREAERLRSQLTQEYIEVIKNDLNEPLNWGDLRTMEGKPVWILESVFNPDSEEMLSRKGHWDIVRKVYPEQITFYVQGMSYHKSWQGIGWNAFRRETNE